MNPSDRFHESEIRSDGDLMVFLVGMIQLSVSMEMAKCSIPLGITESKSLQLLSTVERLGGEHVASGNM